MKVRFVGLCPPLLAFFHPFISELLPTHFLEIRYVHLAITNRHVFCFKFHCISKYNMESPLQRCLHGVVLA